MKRPGRLFGIRYTTVLAAATAAILLAAGVIGAWLAESDFRSQRLEQAEAHARVLAASVTAALAFNEAPEAKEAIDALQTNPSILAVGVYSSDGNMFAVDGEGEHTPPPTLLDVTSSRFEGESAIATARVDQNGQELGRVYVKLAGGSGASQWMRYVGLALLLVMAAVLVAIIAQNERSLAAANEELARRADTLSEANRKLSEESEARRKAERALAQAQKMEAIGQLTGGLAHDFNNLLAAISGGVRLLQRPADAERKAKITTGLVEAIDRGARLTRQLLTFARGHSLEARSIDPCEQITAMLELVRRTIGEDIDIGTNFTGVRWRVRVDPNQFELVILNLAVNARDAMPDGGRLTIGCSHIVRNEPPTGDFVRVAISDTGAGMAPETIDRAFEPFFTTKEVGKGTGLGLAQVYAFARQAGGAASIESELGRGSSVYIDLPRDRAVAEHEPREEKPVARKQQTAPGQGRRVLVVEDDEAVARVVCELIADNGYVCELAASAREALAKLEESQFDLVFSDIVMPGGMSGIDLARELRRTRPGLPVLLTTGFTGKARFEPGEFEIVYKPWTPEDLLQALHRQLSKNPSDRTTGEDPIRGRGVKSTP